MNSVVSPNKINSLLFCSWFNILYQLPNKKELNDGLFTSIKYNLINSSLKPERTAIKSAIVSYDEQRLTGNYKLYKTLITIESLIKHNSCMIN